MGAKQSYGAVGRGDTLNFKPEDLRIITDKNHPLYDPRVEREPEEGMILSIMAHGVIVPAVIFRIGDEVFIKDGHQRRACAIEANKRLTKEGKKPVVIPCVWKRGDDKTLFGISVTTNEVRYGDTPMERAKKMQRAADFNGGDLDAVAVDFGVTTATVKNMLALLECAPVVQRAVEAGKVGATIATKLSKLPKEEQTATLDKMIEAGATKGAAAQKAVRGKGTDEAMSKSLSANARKKMRTALSEGAFETLKGLEAIIAKAVVATLARVDGDLKQLKTWPGVSAIAEDALKPKVKVKKVKAVKKPRKAKAQAEVTA